MPWYLLYGDVMLAVVAVDFMCRERRGAAVQRRGKYKWDRYLLTSHDFKKSNKTRVSPPLGLNLHQRSAVFYTHCSLCSLCVISATTGSLWCVQLDQVIVLFYLALLQNVFYRYQLFFTFPVPVKAASKIMESHIYGEVLKRKVRCTFKSL